MTSPRASFNRRRNFIVDKFQLIQPRSDKESCTYRIPRSLISSSVSFSLVDQQCCTCPVYPASTNSFVQVTALVPSEYLECVDLHCDGVLMRRFPFPLQTILCIRILSLPGTNDVGVSEKSQVVGAVLIIATLERGISTFSIVLEKPKGSKAFRAVECRQLQGCREQNGWNGRRIRSMIATIVNEKPHQSRPFLLIAASSSKEGPGQTTANQRVDVQRCLLIKHTCPVFQLASEPPHAGLSSAHQELAAGSKFRDTGYP